MHDTGETSSFLLSAMLLVLLVVVPLYVLLLQAALVTFGGHANVQHQGSTRKGTGLAASSDWDFYVNLDDTISTVTHMQRMAVVDQLCKQLLPSAGIDYSIRCGVNRAFMWNGSDDRGPLPDVDLVFERFKLDVRRAPKSKAFAHSQVAQQVRQRAHNDGTHKKTAEPCWVHMVRGIGDRFSIWNSAC